ncbi:ABC transporter ATP-binding protein [Corynebacterium mendelii]|uniref:ABC transporter ATP-binding protein n=1 Tax=Corynebacterium mendelii TaxID=2765362 RepID=A0A939DZ48_9CORY|nr:ABC transporter ATP-binding protein [Corynebacterium mendelii]MBN9643915.1 ABC transporter ATP-binding protein [Corynebacterium mendelii]
MGISSTGHHRSTDHPQQPATGLRARHISVGYRDTQVIDDLSLDIPPGQVTTIIGPNGCGKSTLLKALCRLLPVTRGQVELDGVALTKTSSRRLARAIGVLPQNPVAPEGTIVADLVAMGRHPYRSWMRQWAGDDGEVVAQALARTGVTDLSERRIDSLSGGQRQRVWIAMALAQDTDILVLDEPTTYLDLAHSVDVLDLVDTLHRQQQRTVVMVLHDLGLACRYSDHLVVMKNGAIVAQGDPAEIITPELLSDVFGLTSRVIDDPVSDRPLIVPVGRCRTTTG